MAEPSLSVSCRRRTSRTQYSTVWRRCCVNVEELFRRYLEQRREMGESELVLDTLTVEEVLRIVGAHGKRAAAPRQSTQSGDWRRTLLDADAGIAAPIRRVPQADAPPSAPPRPRAPATRPPSTVAAEPPALFPPSSSASPAPRTTRLSALAPGGLA